MHLVRYQGNLLKVHEKINFEPEELIFQRWLSLFEETAKNFFDSNDLKKICLKARMIGGTLFGRLNETDLEVPGFPPSDFF